jgi:hypothetical protein
MKTFTIAIMLLSMNLSAQAANPIHFVKHHKKITALAAAAGGLALGLVISGQQNQMKWPRAKGGPVYCVPTAGNTCGH